MFEKALSLAKLCGSKQHCVALTHLAHLKYAMSDCTAARRHTLEVQQLARLSANLYQEALSLRTEAACLMFLGDLKQSALLSHRARELL